LYEVSLCVLLPYINPRSFNTGTCAHSLHDYIHICVVLPSHLSTHATLIFFYY